METTVFCEKYSDNQIKDRLNLEYLYCLGGIYCCHKVNRLHVLVMFKCISTIL